MHEDDYRPIGDFLQRFVDRLRRVQGLEALCLAGTALAVLAALGVAVDAVKAFSSLRAAGVQPAFDRHPGGGHGAHAAAFPAVRSLSWAARAVERQRPELRNNLINSLQLYPQLADPGQQAGTSAPMILALIRQTRAQISGLKTEALVDTRPLRAKARLLALAAAPVLALAVWLPDFPAGAWRWLRIRWNTCRRRKSSFTSSPGTCGSFAAARFRSRRQPPEPARKAWRWCSSPRVPGKQRRRRRPSPWTRLRPDRTRPCFPRSPRTWTTGSSADRLALPGTASRRWSVRPSPD